MTTFKLSINLGNAEMLDGMDIADALRHVAEKLDHGIPDGKILDRDGNTVGSHNLVANIHPT